MENTEKRKADLEVNKTNVSSSIIRKPLLAGIFASFGIALGFTGFFRGLLELAQDLFGSFIPSDFAERNFDLLRIITQEFLNGVLVRTGFSIEIAHFFLLTAIFGLTGYFLLGTVNKWLGIITLAFGWFFAIFPALLFILQAVFDLYQRRSGLGYLFLFSLSYVPVVIFTIPLILFIGSLISKEISIWKSSFLLIIPLLFFMMTIIGIVIQPASMHIFVKTIKAEIVGSFAWLIFGFFVLCEAWRLSETKRFIYPLLGFLSVLFSIIVIILGIFRLYSISNQNPPQL